MKITSIALMFFTSTVWSQGQVHGILVGHGGKSLTKGLVIVCSLVDGNRVAMVETEASGAFSFRPGFQGLYEIQFLGTGHVPLVFPMNFKKDEKSYLQIQLAPRVWTPPTSDRIRVEGTKDGEPLLNSAALLKSEDESYRGTFECKRMIRYRLFPMGHNTRATEFLYDGGRDFYSIQYPKEGRVEVVVKPSDFASGQIPYSVQIQHDQNMALLRAQELFEGAGVQFGGLVQAQRKSYVRHLEQRRKPADFRWDGSSEISKMEGQLKSANEPLIRDFWIINQWRYFIDCRMPVPTPILDRILHVSSDSPTWVLAARVLKSKKYENPANLSLKRLIQEIEDRNPNKDLIAFLKAPS